MNEIFKQALEMGHMKIAAVLCCVYLVQLGRGDVCVLRFMFQNIDPALCALSHSF